MKSFVLFISLFSALYSEQTIPIKECLHIKYAHTLGGTMHSKTVLSKKLLNKIHKTLPYSDDEVLIMIQNKYPELAIKSNKLIIQNCKVRYQGITQNKKYFFDVDTLDLINKED